MAYQAEGGVSVLGWQLLLTTQKLERSPRKVSAIIQLARDIESNRRKVSPNETQLVDWLTQQPGVSLHSGSHAREDAIPLPVHNVLEWASLWGERGMLFWTDGGRVEFEPQAAKLILQTEADGKTLWAVRFRDEDAPVLPSELKWLADGDALSAKALDPRVYVRRKNKLIRLETGGMPVDLLRRIQRMPEVPIELLRQRGAGVALVERLHLSRETRNDAPGLVRIISVTPVLEFVLADGKELTLVVRADGENGERFYRNATGHWNLALQKESEVPTPPTVTTDEPSSEIAEGHDTSATLCVFPNANDLEPVDAFLKDLIPSSAAAKTSEAGMPMLAWSLNGKAFERFLSAWSRRPAQAQFLGNKPFYNMVMLQKPPGLRVRVESSGMDWLKVSVEMEGEMEALNLNEVRNALSASQDALIALPGGRMYRREDLEEYERSAGALMDMGLILQKGEQRVHAMQLAGMKKDALMELGAVNPNFMGLADRARTLLETFRGIPTAPVHAETAHFLRPYQQQGADFVYWACQSFGGAVLADDMGLGKTLQILATLTALRAQSDEVLPSLVICPASVAHNWQREARRFAPMLRVVTLESGAGRREILKHADQYDIVIMNYALARRDAEHLQKTKWLSICVDEAQAIKNPDSATSQTLKKIEASYRIALTGTPVENRLLDLWSILDFAAPGILPSRREFEQQAKSDDPTRLYRTLRAKLRPLLIRRLKTEVAPELPPRIEERRDCEMAPAQRKAYLAEVKRTRELLIAMREKKLAGKDRFQMLAALTRLRQICCDPSLIGLEKCGSGKTDTLLEIVAELLESGHKTLIFSQFVQMLERLKTALQKRGVPLRMLTGETRNRKDLVDEFEADPTPSVFLISLKAGGTGLNLTSASYVILYDPWWNPAVEAQAIDRTHRIGQDKTVVAYRLVTAGTVEERILALQEQKRGLAKNLLEEESFNRALTRDDFEYLLSADDESIEE
jgi:superfamily II DNA or RNA helicase